MQGFGTRFVVGVVAFVVLCASVVSQALAFESPRLTAQASSYRDTLISTMADEDPADYGSVDQLLRQARLAVREQRYGDAIDYFEFAAGFGSDDFGTWFGLGDAWIEWGRPNERALAAFLNAYRVAPGAPQQFEALMNIAMLLENGDEWDLAIDAYQAAMDLEPNPDLEERLAFLRREYGFRVYYTDVYAERDNPQVCVQFSDPLSSRSSFEYSDYVRMEPEAPIEVSANGPQLCIDGLAHGGTYELRLLAGLPSGADEALFEDYDYTFDIPNREPTVGFRGNAYVLPRGGEGTLPLATVNVDNVDIEVLRINDRNLIEQIVRGRVGSSMDGYDIDEIAYTAGESVWTGDMAVDEVLNREVVTGVPIGDVITDPEPGVYLVVATRTKDDDEDYYYYETRATQWVIITDIGLTTFMGADGLTVAARSLETGLPLAGVSMDLIARNNEVLSNAVTDDEGLAHFPSGFTTGEGGRRPAAVHALGAGDFAFLSLVGSAFDLSDRGVGGRWMPGPLDAYLYTERGVYRPGETVYITTLLRDADAMALDNVPLTVSLIRPDGVELDRQTLSDLGGGAYVYDYDLSSAARSGTWTLQAFADPEGVAIGSVTFQVEDFVPVRIRVDLTPEEEVLHAELPSVIEMQADYLYGAPAADLPGEATILLRPAYTPWPDYADFSFGMVQESFEPVREPLPVPNTDASGLSRIQVALANMPDTTLPLEAVIRASVFDISGRAVNASVVLPVRSERPAIGIRSQFGNRTDVDSPAMFDLVALDGDGQPAALSGVRYELVRENYQWLWYWNGNWDYELVVYDTPVEDGGIDLAAGEIAQLSFDVSWGRYRLDVYDDETGAASSYRFYGGWWSPPSQSNTPDDLEVAFDQESYRIGETARISVTPAFAGELLLVIANDDVIDTLNVSMPEDGAVIEVPVTEDWGVGAYALATLYRPGAAADDTRGPGRAIGVSWMSVDMSERTLDVAMDVPDVVRPRQIHNLEIAVDGFDPGEQAYLTLAAVDEGILLLTRFQSPDPVDYYYGQRNLGVEVADLYGRLIESEGRRGELRFGGDGEEEILDEQSDTPPVRTVRTVALFTGVLEVGPEGTITVPLDIPDYNGELRLMAVAWTADSVGSADAALTVRDPVVSEVTLPRILAPTDVADIVVALHNVDGAPGIYQATLETEGPIALDGLGSFEVELGEDARHREPMLLAADTVGIGELTLTVTGPDGFAIERSWQIAVRPSQPFVTDRIAGLLHPDQTLIVSDSLYSEYLPGTPELAASFSSRPNFDVPGLVRALDRYPYGCAEQIASRAMPLLYLAEVAEAWGDDDEQPRNVDNRIQRAIGQLMSKQTWSGAFSRWNPFGYEDPWLTAYVLDFLTRARQEGFEVPERAYQRGMDWLAEHVSQYDTRSNCRPSGAYALYTLSRAGQADIADLRYYADVCLHDFDSSMSRGQLGVALAAYGDIERAEEAFDQSYQPRLTGVSLQDYGSELRDQAALVALMAEAGYRDEAIYEMAEQAAAEFNRQRYTSTQEQMWLLMAAHALLEGQEDMTLALNGVLNPPTTSVLDLIPDAEQLAAGLVVENAGETIVRRTVTIRGVPIAPRPAEANGFEIERSYMRPDGTPFDPAVDTLTQNDLLVVIIDVNPLGDFEHDMLVVDLLAAGLEIENPRIGEARGLEDMVDDLQISRYLDHVEMRDDRYVAAIDTDEAERFAYLVRAVTPGNFVLPPAFVEDMYTPELNARTEMGRLIIEAP